MGESEPQPSQDSALWYHAVAEEYGRLLDVTAAVFRRRPTERAAEDVALAVARFREVVRIEERTHDDEGRPLGALALDAIDRIREMGDDVRARLEGKTGYEKRAEPLDWLRGHGRGQTWQWLKRRHWVIQHHVEDALRTRRPGRNVEAVINAIAQALDEPRLSETAIANARSASKSETLATRILYEVYVDPDAAACPGYDDFASKLARTELKAPE